MEESRGKNINGMREISGRLKLCYFGSVPNWEQKGAAAEGEVMGRPPLPTPAHTQQFTG